VINDVKVVPEENEAEPPDHAKCENINFTLSPEVNVAAFAEKLPPIKDTPPAMFKDPPITAKTASWIVPATPLLATADAAKLLAPPTRVRLSTPPKVPDSKKEDATDALTGSTSVAPEDMLMEAVCAVNSSRAVYAHS
jgi:hypothetical protein